MSVHETIPHSSIIKANNFKGVGFKEGSYITQLLGSSFQEYNFNDNWRGLLELGYERLVGDAKDSPILSVGSADQFSIGIGLMRKFSIDF